MTTHSARSRIRRFSVRAVMRNVQTPCAGRFLLVECCCHVVEGQARADRTERLRRRHHDRGRDPARDRAAASARAVVPGGVRDPGGHRGGRGHGRQPACHRSVRLRPPGRGGPGPSRRRGRAEEPRGRGGLRCRGCVRPRRHPYRARPVSPRRHSCSPGRSTREPRPPRRPSSPVCSRTPNSSFSQAPDTSRGSSPPTGSWPPPRRFSAVPGPRGQPATALSCCLT